MNYECVRGHICKPKKRCHICGAKTIVPRDEDIYLEFPGMNEEAEQEMAEEMQNEY